MRDVIEFRRPPRVAWIWQNDFFCVGDRVAVAKQILPCLFKMICFSSSFSCLFIVIAIIGFPSAKFVSDHLYKAPGVPILSITFGPIVGDTEHLAVLGRASAALAPCRNVVRVHFRELPNLTLIGSMTYCTERTI